VDMVISFYIFNVHTGIFIGENMGWTSILMDHIVPL
jgi:hypothetical protein